MLTLKYRGNSPIPIEAECLTPDNVREKALLEVARLPVWHGNASLTVGEFFSLEGSAGDGEIVIEGDCSRVKGIGAGMTAGRVTIHGNAGMHLGAGMQGGRIEVFGSADDWAGAEMSGGYLHVHGDAGHLAGAAYRGSRLGMRGGVLLIDGRAGNEVGASMRRGLIAVGGAVGDFPGVSLIAGSLFLFGPTGERPGAGMKRGTLAFLGASPALLPSFRYTGTYEPVFLRLYLRQLRSWGFAVSERHLAGSWSRYAGDLVSLGKGEALVWQERP